MQKLRFKVSNGGINGANYRTYLNDVEIGHFYPDISDHQLMALWDFLGNQHELHPTQDDLADQALQNLTPNMDECTLCDNFTKPCTCIGES